MSDTRHAGTIKCVLCRQHVPKGTLLKHMLEKHPVRPKPQAEAKHEPN